MALIAVLRNGEYVDLPAPKVGGYDCVPNELTKSSRNTLGNLYKWRIAVKRSITISWVAMTPSQKDTILSLTDGNSFQLKYFDPHDAEFKYGKFYRGNDLKITPRPPYKNGEFKYYDITMSFGEF